MTETSQPPPIESFIDAMKRPGPSSSSGFEGRRSAVPPNVTSTSLQFPRVSTSTTTMPPLQVSSMSKSALKKPFSGTVPSNQSISAAAASANKKSINPFETDDDVNNPFVESKPPKNPFEDDDDYDPSLNPFEN